MLREDSAKGASQPAARFALPSNWNSTGICKSLANIAPCNRCYLQGAAACSACSLQAVVATDNA